MYDASASPNMMPKSKYAVMNSKYESVNVPNLYFAGTLSHGKDMRRSSGAFIHGFRYTARALHRILEVDHQKQQWPSTSFTCTPDGIDQLTDLVLKRINTASGPYQMIGMLADAILMHKDGMIQYLEEVPISYLHENHYHTARLHWSFAYWNQRQTFATSIEGGTLFEIHMWFQGGSRKPRRPHSRDFLRLIEAFHTDWDNEYVRRNVQMFLAASASKAGGGNCGEQVHTLAKAWKDSLDADPRNPGESSNVALEGWTPVQMDVWVYNSLNVNVILTVNKKQMGQLEPGQGKMFDTYDGDAWEVVSTRKNRVMLSMVMELGKGKVQDMWIADTGSTLQAHQDEQCDKPGQCDDDQQEPEPTKCEMLESEKKKHEMLAEKLKEFAMSNKKAQEKMGCADGAK